MTAQSARATLMGAKLLMYAVLALVGAGFGYLTIELSRLESSLGSWADSLALSVGFALLMAVYLVSSVIAAARRGLH